MQTLSRFMTHLRDGRLLSPFILCIVLVSGAHAQHGRKQAGNRDLPITVFTINKQPVYASEFMYLYRKNNQKTGDTDEKIRDYLNLFINFKLKVSEAYARGMDSTETFKSELQTYSEELKRPYRTEANDLARLTRQAYQRLTEEIKASHILVTVSPEASPEDTLKAYAKIDAIRKRILEGEDFEKMARQFSEDPSVSINGGSLSYFTVLQMVFPFEDAAYKLNAGEISMPTRTRFGYHLIKVFERRPARGEVEVSHIFIRANPGEEKRTRNKIFEVYDELKTGRGWEDVCKEYSEDAGTKDSGGRLRAFGVGALASVPEFETAAFALTQPGEISDPVQSSIGWHILRLERKVPIPPFEEIETTLQRRISRDERVEISKTTNLNKRKKQFGFVETDAKKIVLSLADSSLSKGHWKYTGRDELKSSILFTMADKKVNVEEFAKFIVKSQKPSALTPADYMTDLYNKFVNERINEAEEAKFLSEYPEYRNLLNEYREGILLFSIMEKEVWTKAAEDTTGQRAFYNSHKTDYAAGDRIEARLFATADRNFIGEIKSRIARGDTLRDADLRKFNSVQNLRKFEKGESKVIDKISWTTGLQETELDGMHYLVEVKRLVLPGPKSFEEARAAVISDYQDYLEKIWMNQLRKKYSVKINSKGKKFVFAELKKADDRPDTQ
jgi:peptidyl-prolyl cis-trans isomerase SurA